MSDPQREPLPFITRLIGFVNALRGSGLTVGTNQLLTWLQALGHVNWREPQVFYHTAKCVLLNRGADRAVFRQVFVNYWGRTQVVQEAQVSRPATAASSGEGAELGTIPLAAGQVGEPTEADEVADHPTAVYSRRELLRRKDFAEMSQAELEQVEQFLAEYRLELPSFRTRRYRRGHGERLDFRASLRRNLRYGGEWLRWDRRQRQRRKRPLLVLADISGSMERYSRLLLLFIHALARGYEPGVEAFVFGTQLSRITPAFDRADRRGFMSRIAELAPDWSGGTRIGRSLETFNMEWARRTLTRRAVVLLISDGWDRGEPDLLARQMARLQRTSASIIWLNPLLGSTGYQVKTRGLMAALPYVDHFLPAHNLENLQDLGRLLQQLSEPGRSRFEDKGQMQL